MNIYRISRLAEEGQFVFDFSDGLSSKVYERILLGFIAMELPVIDEAPYRIFATMKEYRKWANENAPTGLGDHLCHDGDNLGNSGMIGQCSNVSYVSLA